MPQYSRRIACWLGFVLVGLILGCGGSEKSDSRPKQQTKKRQTKKRQTSPRKPKQPKKKSPQVTMGQQGKQKSSTVPSTQQKKQTPVVRQLDGGVGPQLNANRAAAAGIRVIQGKYLTLYTDLPTAADVDELPKVFAAALPQWCKYFKLDVKQISRWKPTAYIIKDKARFQGVGVLRPGLPPFRNGFQIKNELWIYEQPSPYYRRHLLLHEGTHAFMDRFLGGTGPPWYMEGIAEFLGTHRWQNGKLQLAFNPTSREQVPRWARVRLAKDAYKNGLGRSLDQIFSYGSSAHLRVEPYAWCWAAVTFLSRHPKYTARFDELRQRVNQGEGLTEHLRDRLDPDWAHAVREWQLYVANMEYGYDIARSAIEYKPTQPIGVGKDVSLKLKVARGWQSTGIRLARGQEVELAASGRFQLVAKPKKWMSEPGGVTIRYYRGQPLGKLLAAVCDESAVETMTPLAKPKPIGLKGSLTAGQAGTLFLKINDSAAELADNVGTVSVVVRAK